MRSEQEMLDLIVNTAEDDERIRAVVMNGSRANPNAPRDIFQDFDVVYIVTDVAPFKYNYEWLQRFGEIMIMQMPEDMRDPPPCGDGSFVYLMQFTDGNRIDLTLYPLAKGGAHAPLDDLEDDSLSLLLLDKDGLIGSLPPADERDYLPQPPTAKAFADCCNEFWWVCPYVAKGLWREEILYAKHFLDHVVRNQLMKMITWYVGMGTQFSKNPGKFGKYLRQYLEPELWQMLLDTYSDADYEHTWDALDTMCALFRTLALQVAARFGFDYKQQEDRRVRAHLKHVRCLSRDAKEMY
jgi:aminoglycoside 6-adenylyltransferase